jgi:hypothetical protein
MKSLAERLAEERRRGQKRMAQDDDELEGMPAASRRRIQEEERRRGQKRMARDDDKLEGTPAESRRRIQEEPLPSPLPEPEPEPTQPRGRIISRREEALLRRQQARAEGQALREAREQERLQEIARKAQVEAELKAERERRQSYGPMTRGRTRSRQAREAVAPYVAPRGSKLEAAREEERQRIASAIAARTGQVGQGMRILHPRPGRGVKIGRGMPPVDNKKARYAQFGKYLIHLTPLDKFMVSIKYPSAMPINDMPNKQVSPSFVKMVYHFLETDTWDKGMFNALHEDEQSFFYYLARRCQLDIGMNGSGMMTDKDKKEMERFDLIRGQIIAGNNSPELIRELKGYLLRFLTEKRITRAVGNQILYELTMLS